MYRTVTDRFTDSRKRSPVTGYPYRTNLILLTEEGKARYRRDWTPDQEVWQIAECAPRYGTEDQMMEAPARITGMEGRLMATLTKLRLTPVTEQEVIQMASQAVWDEGAAVEP